MGVRRGDDVGPGGVHGGVDHEGRPIDGPSTFDHLSFVIHEDQVRDLNVAKVHAEGIDPEVVEQFGVARRDVTRDALGESQPAEYAQGTRESLLAVLAFGFDRGERGWNVEDQLRLVLGETISDLSHVPPPNSPSSEL